MLRVRCHACLKSHQLVVGNALDARLGAAVLCAAALMFAAVPCSPCQHLHLTAVTSVAFLPSPLPCSCRFLQLPPPGSSDAEPAAHDEAAVQELRAAIAAGMPCVVQLMVSGRVVRRAGW